MADTEHTCRQVGSALRKATLFCGCGHRSHVKGDWRVTETASERRYNCPDCGGTVTVRPKLGAEAGPGAPFASDPEELRDRLIAGPTLSD